MNAPVHSPAIHPTACIHPGAQLGENISVGAFAIVEEGARIGAGCIIHPHAFIGSHVTMGEQNVIGHGAVIGGDPQDVAFRSEVHSEVRIGHRNRIREYVTIHRGTAEGSTTSVGDDCFLMVGVHLAHNVHLGNGVIIANNSLLGGHVHVEDRVFIGGGSVFHQHIRVGKLAITQGNSGFSKNIPPFVVGYEINMAAGLNVVGLRRSGLDPGQRAQVKAAFDLLYRSGLNISQALAAAGEREWSDEARAFWDFVAASKKRGIIALVGSHKNEEEEGS
jgi:UDP-N-acetylglucosamine acyltransferase